MRERERENEWINKLMNGIYSLVIKRGNGKFLIDGGFSGKIIEHHRAQILNGSTEGILDCRMVNMREELWVVTLKQRSMISIAYVNPKVSMFICHLSHYNQHSFILWVIELFIIWSSTYCQNYWRLICYLLSLRPVSALVFCWWCRCWGWCTYIQILFCTYGASCSIMMITIGHGEWWQNFAWTLQCFPGEGTGQSRQGGHGWPLHQLSYLLVI